MAVKSDNGLFCLCLLTIASCTVACSSDSTSESGQPDAINGVDSAVGDVVLDSGAPKDTAVADTATAPDTALDDTAEPDAADAASLCGAGEWRDFATSTCDKCAETPRILTCNDMTISSTGGDWDATKSVLSFSLKASIAEIVSGTATFQIEHTSGSPTTSDIPITVSGDVISMNLGGVFLDPTTTRVSLTKLVLLDRCSVSSTPTDSLTHLHGEIDVADSGTSSSAFFCGS